MATYLDYQDLKRRKPMRPWHEQIIDFMLANPAASLKQMSAHFGKTISHLSIIINTDMFKARLAERRASFNEALTHNIQRKLLTTLDATLDVVQEQLATKRAQLPFKDTTAFVNSTLERLGYGAKNGGTNVNVQVNGVGPQAQVAISASDLQEARALIRKSQEAKLVEPPKGAASASLPLDGEILPLPSEAPSADAA